MRAVLIIGVLIGSVTGVVTAFVWEFLFEMGCFHCARETIELYRDNRSWLTYAVPLGLGVVGFLTFVVPVACMLFVARMFRPARSGA